MFRIFEKHKLYDEVSKHTYGGVVHFLTTRQSDVNPSVTNAMAMMAACIATTARVIPVLERTMPRSLDKVRKDLLALDALAFVVCSVSQAIQTRRRNERLFGLERVWLPMTTTPRDTKEHFVQKFGSELGVVWLDRWQEFRAIESFHDRFQQLTYLLNSSKGHKVYQTRYSNSPSVMLDFNLGLESMAAGLACGQVILDAVLAFNEIGLVMPEDEDLDDEDDDYTL